MNPIKWIPRTFERYFPGQYNSMESHTLICWAGSLGFTWALLRFSIVDPAYWLFTLAITQSVMRVLYRLREGRQKRAYLADGSRDWVSEKELAAKSDVIGPLASEASFWLVVALSLWIVGL